MLINAITDLGTLLTEVLTCLTYGTMFNTLTANSTMALDKNEQELIEKLVQALTLIQADQQDIRTIAETKKIDEDFLARAGQLFDNTEACDVCRHAFHSWRKTLDDETILSFIDDWIVWKRKNEDESPKARVVKMRRNN